MNVAINSVKELLDLIPTSNRYGPLKRFYEISVEKQCIICGHEDVPIPEEYGKQVEKIIEVAQLALDDLPEFPDDENVDLCPSSLFYRHMHGFVAYQSKTTYIPRDVFCKMNLPDFLVSQDEATLDCFKPYLTLRQLKEALTDGQVR